MLDGTEATLDSLRGRRGLLLLFARTSCPFSVAEMPNMKGLADACRDIEVGAAIVNQFEAADAIRSTYEEKAPGARVVCDESGEISRLYGVDAVPYFVVLDGKGRVAQHRSFTLPAASNAVRAMLGLEARRSRFAPAQGG